MSWGAYESSKGCAGLSGFLTLQDMINAYKGMCSVTPRPEEDYTLAMPDNLEDIGKLHNMTNRQQESRRASSETVPQARA